MKTLDKKWKLVLYGCSGLGLNMLNLIIGSYLCSALLTGGFDEHIESWTYLNRDLVIAAVWSVLIFAVKVIDGIIDVPLAHWTDTLRTRWGRRRPAILIGLLCTLVAYLLFLIPIDSDATLVNTIWFGVLLALFYSAYTLTMVTFYGTFAEVLKDEKDRVFVSNIKSVCDVVYFILGFALLPVFISMEINIRTVALIFLPLAATMLIPLFLIKEDSTKDGLPTINNVKPPEKTSLLLSLSQSFRNKHLIYWFVTHSVLNMGLQLFLSGINEFFSSTGLNMTFVMAASFVPVPFTLLLYNKAVKKKGLKFAYQSIVLNFAVGMALMFVCRLVDESLLTIIAVGCGIIVSFSVGAFFSVSYTVPSHLAAEANKKGIACASSMYFAVQGMFEGVATGISTGLILVFLKENDLIQYMTLLISAFCLIAFFMAFFLPKSIALLGKQKVSHE